LFWLIFFKVEIRGNERRILSSLELTVPSSSEDLGKQHFLLKFFVLIATSSVITITGLAIAANTLAATVKVAVAIVATVAVAIVVILVV